jgi:hypothetical protein
LNHLAFLYFDNERTFALRYNIRHFALNEHSYITYFKYFEGFWRRKRLSSSESSSLTPPPLYSSR